MSEERRVVFDSFSRRPMIQVIKKEVKVVRGGGGRQGPAGPAGPAGEPGADGTVPDDALVEVNTGLWTIDFSTPFVELDLGTGGYAGVRYRRVGRIVEGVAVIQFGTDFADTPVATFCIPGSELPVIPRTTTFFGGGGAEVGGFGFITKAESSGGAADGYRHALIPANINIGVGPALFFIIGSSLNSISGGAGNIWGFADGTPIDYADLAGAIYVGRFFYEAASAA